MKCNSAFPPTPLEVTLRDSGGRTLRKNYFIESLGPYLSILILAGACGDGEIGGLTGRSRSGPDDDLGSQAVEPSDPAALYCEGASPDVAARNGWRSADASRTIEMPVERRSIPTSTPTAHIPDTGH